MKNERSGKRPASIAGKWGQRLRARPKQTRFNISRRDLRALLGSTLTQAPDRVRK